jgi:hypothetical protein
MSFPLGDWQFWAVTAGAVAAASVIVRPFVRRASPKDAAACAHCKHAASIAPERADGGEERLVTIGKFR